MAGLVKAKKFDWTDTNISLFGSDTDKQVKKESAQTEAAWRGAGQKVGVQIWRIVQFKVKHWPKDDYGRFYDGDSYVILNTYKKPDSDELLYDVHFWIGKWSTQDEYATAAYKTVELDTLLDDKPIQHREVQGFESSLFKGYFKTIEILCGGAETGFKHVEPAQYKPRLLHFHGDKKGVEIKEKPLTKCSIDSSDVFILDLGLEIYQWNGKTCNKDEKFKAVQHLQTIKSERNGKPKVESIDERDMSENHKFYSLLKDDNPDDADDEADCATFGKKLFRVSDASGDMTTTLEAEGDAINRDCLDPKDVFIFDNGHELVVWIGQETSTNESQNGLSYAHKYLRTTQHPLISVTTYRQNAAPNSFYDELVK